MWDQLAEGVYRRRYTSLDLNIGLVLGGEGVLVVDTRASTVQAHELVEDLRRVTALPVRWVVDTHWHWDHTFGNSVFATAPVWAHTECRRVLAARGEEAKLEVADKVEPERRDEILSVQIRLPDQVFDVEEVIDLGGRSVTLRHHGLGHTEGDITVTVDGTGVRFAGDLLEQGAPPSFGDGYPISWPATLERVIVDGIATYVPGHGDVMTPDQARAQRDELFTIATMATEASANRVPVEDIDLDGSPYPSDVTAEAMVRAYLELAPT